MLSEIIEMTESFGTDDAGLQESMLKFTLVAKQMPHYQETQARLQKLKEKRDRQTDAYKKKRLTYKLEGKTFKELNRLLDEFTYLSIHVDEIDFDEVYDKYPGLKEEGLEGFLRDCAKSITSERAQEVEEWYAQLKPNGKTRTYIQRILP